MMRVCCLYAVGDVVLLEYEMERIMEQLEMRCYDGLQEAMKTTEGIGIEYDEDVVCDICRSVRLMSVSSITLLVLARQGCQIGQLRANGASVGAINVGFGRCLVP